MRLLSIALMLGVAAALPASAPPIPPQPISAIPGRSFGPSFFGFAVAAASSRSTNQNGSPVIAASTLHRLINERRLTLKRFNSGVLSPAI